MYLLSDFSIKFIIIIFIALLGACIGSFLNVVIYRLPRMLLSKNSKQFNLAYPRSHCVYCKKKLTFIDLLPIISFILLAGKCRFCKKKLFLQEPLIELLTALSFVLIYFFCNDIYIFLSYIWLICLIIPLIMIDINQKLLPDSLTLTLLWSGLILSCYNYTNITPCESIFGAATGYMCLRIFVNCYEYFRKSQAMGGGDFKLFAAIGAWTGNIALPLILFISSCLGLIFTVIWRITNKEDLNGKPIAFGPWLILGWGIFEILNYAKLYDKIYY